MTCLNCGAALQGEYCHVCGQQNTDPKESTWHLFRHFLEDMTHFDGKLANTLRCFYKPGFLANEYLQGRRARYVNPIKLYFFTSAIFFLLFFAAFRVKPPLPPAEGQKKETFEERRQRIRIQLAEQRFAAVAANMLDSLTDVQATTVQQYDSLQSALPPARRSWWFDRYLDRSAIVARESARHEPLIFFTSFVNSFLSSLSKIFFISLPLFALFLYLLYWPKRHTYNYVAHFIFAVYYYCAVFFVTVLPLLLGMFSITACTVALLAGSMVLYVYMQRAMKNFYKEGKVITYIKFLSVNMVSSAIILFLALVFAFHSLLTASHG